MKPFLTISTNVLLAALAISFTSVSVQAQGEAFCFGDGGDQAGCTDCPCGNNATPGLEVGCLNSAGRGAELAASGRANVNNDTLRFEMEGGLPNTFGLLVSGDDRLPNNPANSCFGMDSGTQAAAFDGLRCIGGNFRRHGTRATDTTGDIGLTNAGWGDPDAPTGGLSTQGSFAAGQTRQFQIIYRDDEMAGCGTGLNTTNGVSVTFVDLDISDVYFDDFEGGLGGWFADNGLWQVGVPTSGPPSGAYSGVNVAATLLGGNYPDGQDSRLISPLIQLPTVTAGQELRLNYRHWFSYGAADSMIVQVSDGSIGSWTTIACASSAVGSSAVWAQHSADLTDRAGQTIRLAFFTQTHNNNGGSADPGAGSFIDDVHIVRGTPISQAPETFTNGLGDWWRVSNGLWEVGIPTNPGCLSGEAVGTVIDGNYPDGQDSRLISPPIIVPSLGFPLLRFEHWFSFGAADSGVVQVSTDNGCTWASVGTGFVGSSAICTSTVIDMSPFAGQTVLIGFYCSTHNNNGGSADPGRGWYLDNIRLE